MLLRSCSFQKELSNDAWDVLFENYKNFVGEFDYGVEIIEAALDNRIDLTKPFNLFGYCKVIRENRKQEGIRSLKHNQYIVDDDEEDKTGVSISSIVDPRDDYEISDDNNELAEVVEKLKKANAEIIVVFGLDLLFCIKQAIKGTPQAVEELSKICKELDWVGEYVKIILSSGIPFSKLFPNI